jgi:RimJ/RimL family protein N-acetyltransferase
VSTDRLELRRPRSSDLDGLAVVFAKPEVWRFPYGRPFDRDETRAFLERQQAAWDLLGYGLWIASKRDGPNGETIVGYVGLSVPTFLPEILPAVEVGWRFDPVVWGRGYATEAASAALDEGFATLGLEEICSIPQADNPASVRVAERLGMRLEREVDLPATDQRGAVTGAIFKITPSEWRGRRPG